MSFTWSETLKVLHVADGHLDDFGLLDAAPAFLQVLGGYESAEVGQTVVHAIPPALFDYSVRHRILLKRQNRVAR